MISKAEITCKDQTREDGMYYIYDFKEAMMNKSKVIIMTRYCHKIVQRHYNGVDLDGYDCGRKEWD